MRPDTLGSPTTDIALGRPEFGTAALQSLAERDGPVAAWRQALTGDLAAALARTHGNFAVATQLDDGRVVLAVDRFAIETLCYRLDNGRLRFAPRADLLTDGTHSLDPQGLFDYLYFHAIASPRTVFSGVHRLPPGHFAVFQGGQITVAPYWTPRFEATFPSPSFEALKKEFNQILRDAVARQLDQGKPGCFLSGGTDSSTVAGLLGQAAGRQAASYSIGFDAEGYDEMAYARIAARHFGTEHHEYYVTPEDLVRSIPEVASSYDQPFGNSSALPAYFCARMARDDGVSRILAGDGGDELFGGNTRYAKQRVFGWYDQVPAAVRALIGPVFALGPVAATPGLGKVSSYIRQASVPMPDRTQSYNLLERLGVHDVLTPGFLACVNPQGPHEQQRSVWAQAQASKLIDRQLAFDWRYTLAESDLPKVCGTIRLAGLEVGFPMLDAALTDFSLRLPASYKLKGLKLRWFFKEALRGFLPDEILVKKKQGFGLPFGVWAQRHPGLNRLARDTLASLSNRGMVQRGFISQLMDKRLAEHPGYYGEMVWILVMLEQWLQHHAPDTRFDN
jgi:asparagine synthase (glutamine-hydrolysing)